MMNRRAWLARVGQAIVAGLASPMLLQRAPSAPVIDHTYTHREYFGEWEFSWKSHAP